MYRVHTKQVALTSTGKQTKPSELYHYHILFKTISVVYSTCMLDKENSNAIECLLNITVVKYDKEVHILKINPNFLNFWT